MQCVASIQTFRGAYDAPKSEKIIYTKDILHFISHSEAPRGNRQIAHCQSEGRGDESKARRQAHDEKGGWSG